MNITFDSSDIGRANERVSSSHTNIDKITTKHSSAFSVNAAKSGVALGISDTVMDNTAYGGHGRTAEDVMQEADAMDVAVSRDYMTVMSNSMSTEDFAQMQKEGFKPGGMEIEEVVTIVDHIKVAMVKGGTQVEGYTDDLDAAALEELTGSKALAAEILKQFKAHDIPVTPENVKEAKKAYEKMSDINELSEGAVRYLVENQMEPTIDNLYWAQFSGANATSQGRGYYADTLPGYYAHKAEAFDWNKLSHQMESVIEAAGYEADTEAMEDCKWLLEKGMPLTEEFYTALQQVKGITFPQSMEDIIFAVAVAVSEGKQALNADLSAESSVYEKAVDYQKQVEEISGEAVDRVIKDGKILNLKNLLWEQRRIAGNSHFRQNDNRQNTVPETAVTDQSQEITARRQLAEVRLTMTIEANLKLLKSGFAIETAPLQSLIEQLKNAELAIQKSLTGEESPVAASEKAALFQDTVTKLNEIRGMPLALVGRLAVFEDGTEITLNKVHETGAGLKNQYDKANESYEALMTAPRRDMGDTIQKAFRNVDDILNDMQLEITEQNQRAVRILAYNNMELTEENILKVTAQDSLLTETIDSMKPGAVLSMIREGISPLDMPLEDVRDYFQGKTEFSSESIADYSRFLYQMEQKDAITQQERDAYIGVYRLLRQIEKGDHSAIGSLVETGEEISLSNLLKAVRSSKKQGMDVLVNDQFGGVSAMDKGSSISQQIEQAINHIRQEGSQFLTALDSEEANISQMKDEISEIRDINQAEDTVIRMLTEGKQPVTANNLLAANAFSKYPGLLFKKTSEYAKTLEQNSHQDELAEAVADLQDNFTDKESVNEAYGKLQDTVSNILQNALYENKEPGVELKNIGLMYKQISLASSLAKEERYEVPVMIDGELSSIHLRVIHGDQKNPKVSAGMWTEAYGKVAAEFEVKDGALSGYIACDNNDGLQKLSQGQEDFISSLQDAGFATQSVHYIHSKQLDIHNFTQKNSNETTRENDTQEQAKTTKVSTRELYQAAKVFIGYIQKSSNN